MQIIRRSHFRTVPWNNGGGITHEVSREDVDGKMLWRLSLAEVGQDGPFSLFPGLARILTVIDGAGMDLVSPGGTLVHALPLLRPVYFSGDEELAGRLREGPCLDFNLIYDPKLFNGAAIVLSGRETLVPTRADVEGVLCLSGAVHCGDDTLNRHDFAFVSLGDPPLTLSADGKALRLTLTAR
ncbi:MAG: HutD family protein [Rhizobiales bacterium]|nr:HutD family protein [Hyphomicrobiales bacterium]